MTSSMISPRQSACAGPSSGELKQRSASRLRSAAPAAPAQPRRLSGQQRPAVVVRAGSVDAPSAAQAAQQQQRQKYSPESDAVTAELAEFLKVDLPHLFDDQGIDTTRYDDPVLFEDPITRYSSLQGYLFNIQFLRRAFDPEFILHDVRRTGEWELTTRWTMTMEFTLSRALGPLRSLFDPRLTFTGTSVMGINPATRKFNSHKDTWDAVQQQEFFSLEAFQHMLSQLADLKRTPALEGPKYVVLRKTAVYEVRKYDHFLVAEAPMGRGASSSSSGGPSSASGNPASSSGFTAFGALASYIFGSNERQQRYEMTTPVFSDTRGRMQFSIGGQAGQALDPGALPAPTGRAAEAGVSTRVAPGGIFAARAFSGLADERQVEQEAAELRRAVQAAGQRVVDEGYILARYNEPGVLPPFRRNEVLMPLEDFQLW